MQRYDPSRRNLALGLAFLAGVVDASGFLVANGYFTSFMSGNTTRMAVHLGQAPQRALLPLALITAFVVGVFAGAVLQRRHVGHHKRVLLSVVAALLTLAAVALPLAPRIVYLCGSALAMGVANNVFSRDGQVTVGVTYMTGALVKFGQGLAARLAGDDGRLAHGYGRLWLALALGAVAGTLLHQVGRAAAPGIAALIAWILAAAGHRIEGRAAD